MSRYFYPNDRRNPAGAIPIYMVAGPLPGNKQNNGAIPINMVAVGTQANAGPIPVRVVATTGPGPKWPSDQGQDAGAIPCYNSPNGIPVWNASGPAPLPPPLIDPAAFVNLISDLIISGGIDVVGTCTASNGPIDWSMGANATILSLTINRVSGQIIILNGLLVTVNEEYKVNIIATNSSGFDVEEITMIWN